MSAIKEIDNIQEKLNWHWRNSMRPARFFGVDARAAIPFLVLLVYFRPVTLFITIMTVLVFQFLEKKGLTFPAALRNLRAWIVGVNRPGYLSPFHKKFEDYE